MLSTSTRCAPPTVAGLEQAQDVHAAGRCPGREEDREEAGGLEEEGGKGEEGPPGGVAEVVRGGEGKEKGPEGVGGAAG